MRRTVCIIGLLALLLAGACASQPKPNKRLKPGKPIPCPQKDC